MRYRTLIHLRDGDIEIRFLLSDGSKLCLWFYRGAFYCDRTPSEGMTLSQQLKIHFSIDVGWIDFGEGAL